MLQVQQVDPYCGEVGELSQHLADELSSDVHTLDVSGRFVLDHCDPRFPWVLTGIFIPEGEVVAAGHLRL
ncbi:hypothetical protein GCM10017557_79660 [Streptomyces aurantiacus]|uniref:Uncharacterized protein n=1 Tax=Streptomyces aurantiacus TaxID=47760 RepID=A0A7G1PGP7_9ACTN|nr:hypothetical protein GCM10017557_79660 [Streptomyces aurantiacus]